jgi:hypothetical protein
MARRKNAPSAEPRIHTAEGEYGDVQVRLSFPTRMGVGADKRPFVSLEITDGPSRMLLFQVDIPAEDFTGMLGGSTAHLSGATLPKHPERIGRRSQTTATEIRRADLPEGSWTEDAFDTAAEQVRQQYLTDGWEAVSVHRNNFGRTVVATRWID